MSHLVVVFVVTAEHDQTAPGDWERVEDLLSCFPPHVGILEKRKPCIWRHEQLNHKKTCSAAFRHTLWSYHRKRKPCIWRHELLNLRAVEDLLTSFPPHVGILPQKKEALHMTTRTVKLKGSRRPAQLLSATRWDPGKKEALHMTTQTVKILEDLLGCFPQNVGILTQKKEAL